MRGARRAQWHREREEERRLRRAALKPPIAARLPQHLDVAAIRLGLPRRPFAVTQQGFANRFGFSAGAVRDWEQGRRKPEGAARLLLTLIAHNAAAVEVLIHQALGAHLPMSAEAPQTDALQDSAYISANTVGNLAQSVES